MAVYNTRKKAVQVPSMDIPVKEPVAVPTKESTLEEKATYLKVKAREINPLSYVGFDQVKYDEQVSLLNTMARALVDTNEEFYELAVLVNAPQMVRIIRMPLSQLPDNAVKAYIEKETAGDSAFDNRCPLYELRTFISDSFGIWPNSHSITDYLLDQQVYPTAAGCFPGLVPNLSGSLFTLENKYQELQSMYQSKGTHNIGETAFNSFLIMLRSPYSIQPRTLETMHSMLVQIMTQMQMRDYTRNETIPDSVVRRHLANNTYKVSHQDIIKIWHRFLTLVCDRHENTLSNYYSRLEFTEFLCSGHLTAAMADVFDDMKRYALQRYAGLSIIRLLADKVSITVGSNDSIHRMGI